MRLITAISRITSHAGKAQREKILLKKKKKYDTSGPQQMVIPPVPKLVSQKARR
jgi:hypothetical protein